MKDRRSSMKVFLVMFSGLLILCVATIIFGLEQPMDRQEREVMLKAQQIWSRAQRIEKESDLKDEEYLETRANHRWCGAQLTQMIKELNDCNRKLLLK